MATASFAAVIIGLLFSYCYRVPSIVAIPDKKDIYVEDDWPLRRSYSVEDFLWSGSGDGQQDGGSGSAGDGHAAWQTITIVHTTVILTTVYPTPIYTTFIKEYSPQAPSCSAGLCTPHVSPSGSIQPTPTFITPTPTVIPPGPNRNASVVAPDQRFWLLTVLRLDRSVPEPRTSRLETVLAQLYKLAFNRQQEHHLGINNATAAAQFRTRRAHDRRIPERVTVCVHNKTSKNTDELELLYTVHVAGKPVLAVAAAEDMKLVSNTEVTAELGYPVVTKAEPYLKSPFPLDRGWKQGRSRDTWLLVGAAIAAVCLLLLLIALLALGLGKRKRGKRRVLAGGRQSGGTRREGGTTNLGYEDDVDFKGQSTSGSHGSKTSPSFVPVASSATVTFRDADIITDQKFKGSHTSLSSGESSETSLVRRRQGNGCNEEKEYPSHASTQRKECDRRELKPDDELLVRDSPPVKPKVGTTVSPNSFLSMPSIKAFPRGANIPEPLARVLEPVNVRHLDLEGGGIIAEPARRLTRHGSVEGEDPGVIGPVVWDLHCHRVQCYQQHHGILDETVEDLVLETTRDDTTGSNVGRMRRRFHELLDDTFSLFGSQSGSPGAEEDGGSPPTLHRVHSAIVRPVCEPPSGPSEAVPRPRTTGPRRPATAAASASRPRGAWGTCATSPHSGTSGTLPRPLSAGPFHRPQLPGPVEIIVDRTLVLSDGQLPPSDPAIPLIAAIKEELRKFQGTNVYPAISLPGSASLKP